MCVSEKDIKTFKTLEAVLLKVSNELQRLCRLHEEKPRDGKSYGDRFEIEQRIAEQYAKSKLGLSRTASIKYGMSSHVMC